jgi:hypothetical protein
MISGLESLKWLNPPVLEVRHRIRQSVVKKRTTEALADIASLSEPFLNQTIFGGKLVDILIAKEGR